MSAGNWDLPEILREVAAVIGREKTLYLTGHFLRWERGGHRGKASHLYVPKKLKPDHQLVRLLGEDDAAALVEAFGGEILPVSSCAGVVARFRNDEIRRLAAAGASNDNLSEIFGLTDRHVRAIKAA